MSILLRLFCVVFLRELYYNQNSNHQITAECGIKSGDARFLVSSRWRHSLDEEITVISWVETSQMCGRPHITRVWMRSDPPTIARKSNIYGSHSIFDVNIHQTTNNLSPYVQVMEMARPFGFGSLAKWIFAPDHSEPGGQGTDSEVATSLMLSRPTWSQTDIEEEGKLVAKYERRYLLNNFEVEEVVIADRDTRLIIRSVQRQYELQTHQVVAETVKDQFTANQPVPKGTFEMPKWKLKQRMSVDTIKSKHMPPVTDDATKAGVQKTIKSCDEAWRMGTWSDFADVWKFQALTRLPSESDWRKEFDKNTGGCTEWESSTQTLEMTSYVMLSTSSHCFQMLHTKKPVIHLRATLCAARGEKQWEGSVDYYLQETGSGYRIVHATLPIDEIEITLNS